MKKISKIYVVSKGKPLTASTYNWFKQFGFTNYVTILSYGDNAKEYKKNYGGEVHVCPKNVNNLSKKREYIMTMFAKKGDWVFMMCDNIVDVTGVAKGIINPSKKDFDRKISPMTLLNTVNHDCEVAESLRYALVGYACNSNHFFRTKHIREVGFVWGKMIAVRKTDMKWDHSQSDMDDYVLTATSLFHHGGVRINNFVFPISKRFEEIGGNGSYENRINGKQNAAKYLVEHYKGMFRYKQKPGKAENSEVQMRFTSKDQVAKWRTQFL